MRYAFAVTLLFILACSGPGVLPIDRGGFSMEMTDGTVTEDEDLGAVGNFNIKWGFSSQTLSWDPVEEEDTLEGEVELQWASLAAIMDADESLSSPAKPTFVKGVTAGQPSLGFETDISGVGMLSTTFRCPQAGIQLTLATTGLSGAATTHGASLASAICKTTLLEREAGPMGYRFVGDTTAWTVTDSDDIDQRTEWTRSDELVTVYAFSQSALVEEAAWCEAMLGMARDQFDLTLDSAENEVSASADGCRLDFGGQWTDGDGAVRVRLIHEGCGGDGYVSACVVKGDEPLDGACKGVVACEDPTD